MKLDDLDFTAGAPVKKLELAGGKTYSGNAKDKFADAKHGRHRQQAIDPPSRTGRLTWVRFPSPDRVPESGTSSVCFSRARRTAPGRQRQCVAFGYGRSAGILCRAMVATRERPLSLSLTFSAA